MSEEIRKLQERKEKLLQAIENTKDKKKKIIKISQDFVYQLQSGRLTRRRYEEKLRHALNNRRVEQWAKYYDEYVDYYKYQIKLCDKLIKESGKEKKLKLRKKPKEERVTIYESFGDVVKKSKVVPVLKVSIIIIAIALMVSLVFILRQPLGDFSKNILDRAGIGVKEAGEGIERPVEKPGEEIIGEDGEVLGRAPRGRGRGRGRGRREEILEIGEAYIESTKQDQAVVGQPVKWNKTIITDSKSGFNIELHEDAKNVKIISKGRDITEDVRPGEKWFGKEIKVELKDNKIPDDVVNGKNKKGKYQIIYETPAPKLEKIEKGVKTEFKITGHEDIHYVEVFTNPVRIPEKLKVGEEDKLKLYQTKKDGVDEKKQIPITAYDTDENGLIDSIEWIVPMLSDWEGYLIIEISKAEHLNSSRGFISDIYEQVIELDDIWSEVIKENEYVKVTFEKQLSKVNDITIYPKIISGNPRIEVYEFDSDEKIAEFDSLVENEYNKILLTNLPEDYYQDVFDLKVVNGNVSFDHIIDPDWDWYSSLSSWTGKKKINITSTSVLSDYQVKLDVDWVSGMETNFDDLRFTSASQSFLLDYWIEDYTSSTSAEVWVKVPNLIIGNTSIYMYYNYGSATSVSSIDDTFILADKYLTPIWRNSFGGYHSCVLEDDGTVTCWGADNEDQTGGASSITNAIAVATGIDHSCALIDGGTIDCWGANYWGQAPSTVDGIDNAVSLALGGVHSCALLSDGDVKCWGDNSVGQSGPNCNSGCTWGVDGCCNSPDDTVGLSSVIDISAGNNHVCAVFSNGDVKCWGDSYLYNEAGTNCYNGDGCWTTNWAANSGCCETPELVSEVSSYNVNSTGLGLFHSCALINTGNVRCWGDDTSGQAPSSLGITNAIIISSGFNHSCLVENDGDVVCWGENTYEQTTPIGVSSDAVSLGLGGEHSCALLEDGDVVCWGDDTYDQVDEGTLPASYNLGGRFDKDDQLTGTTTSLDIPTYGTDDFFLREYAASEPSSNLIGGLHECAVGSDCPGTEYCNDAGAYDLCEPTPECNERVSAGTGYGFVADNADPNGECTVSYTSCDDLNTRIGGDGFCDGAGACDTNDASATVGLGDVCQNGNSINPNSGSDCGSGSLENCYCAIWNNCVNMACFADQYYTGFSGEVCTSSDWVDTDSNYDVPDNERISVTNQGAICTTDTSACATSTATTYSCGGSNCGDDALQQISDDYCGSGTCSIRVVDDPTILAACDTYSKCQDNGASTPATCEYPESYYEDDITTSLDPALTDDSTLECHSFSVTNECGYENIDRLLMYVNYGTTDNHPNPVRGYFGWYARAGYNTNPVKIPGGGGNQYVGIDGSSSTDASDAASGGPGTVEIEACYKLATNWGSFDDNDVSYFWSDVYGPGTSPPLSYSADYDSGWQWPTDEAQRFDTIELECGQTISSPGVYKLEKDIFDYSGTCFTITSSDVELDCQGHVIEGVGGSSTDMGIYVDGDSGNVLNNIIIKNCSVNEFNQGIYVEYMEDSLITNTSVSFNYLIGIEVQNSNNNIFSNLSMSKHKEGGSTARGIYLTNSDFNNLTDSVFYNNSVAIGVNNGASNNRFFRLNITNNTRGFWVINLDSDNNYIYDNFFNNTDNEDLVLSESYNNFYNTPKDCSQINIIGGDCIGGNYWAKPDGTGFSEICKDTNRDGFCDMIYDLGEDPNYANNDSLALNYILPDFTAPSINFTWPTLMDGKVFENNFIPINVTANDTQSDVSVFIDFNKSLVGWWRMDDLCNGGLEVCDNSSYGNNGTLSGGLDFNDITDGKMGKALEFDGDGDYVEIVDDPIFTLTKGFTASAWINLAEIGGSTRQIVGQWGSTENSAWIFYLASDTKLSMSTGDGVGYSGFEVTTSLSSTGVWYHVVAVYDGGTTGTNAHLYIDGVLKGEETINREPQNSNYDVRIGLSSNDGRDFNGSIDDVMVFNRALSSEEIAGLYANRSLKYLFRSFNNLYPGNYTFKAYAQDIEGNVNMTREREVEVLDVIAPKISFEFPTPGNENLKQNFIPINVSASDLGRGDNNVSVFIDFNKSLVGWWRMGDGFDKNPIHEGSISDGDQDTGDGGAKLNGAHSVFVSGNYAYVTSVVSDALEIIDISTPSAPTHEGSISDGDGGAKLNAARDVYVSGNYAYVVTGDTNVLEIIDISNPSAPTHEGSISDGDGGAKLDSTRGVFVSGNYAYVTSSDSDALEIIDISTPSAPTHEGSISDGDQDTGDGGAKLNWANSVYVSGNYAYVTSLDGLEIIDISNPSAPTHEGSISNGEGGAKLDSPQGVYVSGNYAYITSDYDNALEIIDISNPSAPTHEGSISDGDGGAKLDNPKGVFVSGNYAYVASDDSEALEIIDISNPSAPTHEGSISDGDGGAQLNAASDVFVSGNYAYVTPVVSDALEIIKLDPIVSDDSSYFNFGEIMGDPEIVEGKLGKAMEFDGVGDYIEVDETNLDFGEESYSISMWVYNEAGSATNPTLFNRGTDGGSDGLIWIYTSGLNEEHLTFKYEDNIGPITSTFSIVLGKDVWNHVVFVFDASNEDLNLYVDGIDKGPSPLTDHEPPNNGNLFFGSYQGSGDEFDGSIDDVMIFDRSLSVAEIQGLYANTSKKYLFNNFIDLVSGNYTFKAYAQDTAGNVNMTEEREVDFCPTYWSKDFNLKCADASFIGEDASDHSGISVSYAGDVNGDGYDDLIIGAEGNNNDGGDNAGQSYLIFGKASGWIRDIDLSNADASFIGESVNDLSGNSVSYAGDVNGDGYDDLIIGAFRGGGGDVGQSYLIFGSLGLSGVIGLSNADVSFMGENADDLSGISVSYAGDVNGDGYDDLIIGAHTGGVGEAGQSYLIFGSSGLSGGIGLSNADASFIGENVGDLSGFSVSYAGDVNGDGYDDLIIGAPRGGGGDAGQSYLIFGSSGLSGGIGLSNADASFIGEDASDLSGISVSYAGDVNADGYDDLIIGAGENDEGGDMAGQSYLIFGSLGLSGVIGLSNADASFIGESVNDLSGNSVSYAGDVNGDGYDDLIIGAPRGGGDMAGQSYLIFGDNSDYNAKTISSVVITENSDYSGQVGEEVIVRINDPLYVNLAATGGDPGVVDVAIVLVNSEDDLYPIKVKVIETGINTNEYHGRFYVRTGASSFSGSKRIRVLDQSTVYVTSLDNGAYSDEVRITYTYNRAPTIEKFIGVFEDDDINGADDDVATGVGEIVGDAGGQAGTGVVNVRFKFVVEDLDNDRGGSTWDLPGMTAGPAINYGTNLIVTFTNPSSNNLGMSQGAGAGDCAATDCFGDSDCDDQSASTNQVKYTCDIDMNYNDPRSIGSLAADLWTINVDITDSTGSNSDSKESGNSGFTALADNYIDYWTIQGVSVPVSTELAWGTLDINTADNPADGPLVMDNAGNIAVVSEDVTARNLQENGVSANQLLATAFAASDTLGTGAGAGACSEGGDGTDDGMDLVHNVAQEVAVRIAYTGGGIGTDQSNMYYCIWPAVSAVHLTGSPATSYVANNANSNEWGIDFNTFTLVLIKFIRFNFGFSLLLVAVRIKKKKVKKKLKKNKLLSYKELLDLNLILKKKYNIGIKELLRESKKKVERSEKVKEREIKIPACIFANKLSPAEALSKYLKENKKMKFSEIGRLINRDERGIWSSYNNGVKKMKFKIKVGKESKERIPIKIFSNRRLSILEGVIKYLKKQGYRNIEIAEMIRKDQRNISSLYSRIRKKLR